MLINEDYFKDIEITDDDINSVVDMDIQKHEYSLFDYENYCKKRYNFQFSFYFLYYLRLNQAEAEKFTRMILYIIDYFGIL